MPFDPAPQHNDAQHGVFSLEGLIAWLEQQDPETEYDFTCVEGDCLIGRYLRATTGRMWRDFGYTWGTLTGEYPELEDVSGDFPCTYGAALERARALLAEQKEPAE